MERFSDICIAAAALFKLRIETNFFLFIYQLCTEGAKESAVA